MHLKKPSRPNAFTLIELLVVISIIGLLVGLLVPAVQMARESARKIQCSNHVKQLAMSVLNFENTYKHLPSGGWGIRWAGLPEQGLGPQQPGGWIYQTLPFLEQNALHALGGVDNSKLSENARRLATPVPILYCPSRRGAEATINSNRWQPHYYPLVLSVARNDYAMNGGTTPVRYGPGPVSIEAAKGFAWPDMRSNTGVCFQRSKIRFSEITDGLTATYLLGEKHLPRSAYLTGEDLGDNEGAYSGDDRDLIRYTGHSGLPGFEPLPDSKTRNGDTFSVEGYNFGSAHSGGLNMAFVDGSVHFISFSIDSVVHSNLGNRKDGHPTPGDSF